MIRIGTSGYNHRDWIGSFYPGGLGPARYLARYAEEFDLCELNVAVHRLPEPGEAERILGESEGRLLFTALAPRRLLDALQAPDTGFPAVGAGFLASDGGIPEIPGRDCARGAELDRFLASLRGVFLPYARAERFGGLVLPLPRSVAATEEALATIARFRDRLEDLPLLVEPRDASWADEGTLDFLRTLGVGLVLADGPDPEGPPFGPDSGGPRPLPARRLIPFAPVTAGIACVRFHGRDGQTRWTGGAARRDYLYSWEELVGWLPTLRALAVRARDLLIVFNNPWRGRAIENARMMRRLIGHEGRQPARETRELCTAHAAQEGHGSQGVREAHGAHGARQARGAQQTRGAQAAWGGEEASAAPAAWETYERREMTPLESGSRPGPLAVQNRFGKTSQEPREAQASRDMPEPWETPPESRGHPGPLAAQSRFGKTSQEPREAQASRDMPEPWEPPPENRGHAGPLAAQSRFGKTSQEPRETPTTWEVPERSRFGGAGPPPEKRRGRRFDDGDAPGEEGR